MSRESVKLVLSVLVIVVVVVVVVVALGMYLQKIDAPVYGVPALLESFIEK